jgi:hypothetical protein
MVIHRRYNVKLIVHGINSNYVVVHGGEMIITPKLECKYIYIYIYYIAFLNSYTEQRKRKSLSEF